MAHLGCLQHPGLGMGSHPQITKAGGSNDHSLALVPLSTLHYASLSLGPLGRCCARLSIFSLLLAPPPLSVASREHKGHLLLVSSSNDEYYFSIYLFPSSFFSAPDSRAYWWQKSDHCGMRGPTAGGFFLKLMYPGYPLLPQSRRLTLAWLVLAQPVRHNPLPSPLFGFPLAQEPPIAGLFLLRTTGTHGGVLALPLLIVPQIAGPTGGTRATLAGCAGLERAFSSENFCPLASPPLPSLSPPIETKPRTPSMGMQSLQLQDIQKDLLPMSPLDCTGPFPSLI